jgi:hypothetical protein
VDESRPHHRQLAAALRGWLGVATVRAFRLRALL